MPEQTPPTKLTFENQRNGRYIGVLISSLNDSRMAAVWDGICKTALKTGYNLMSFAVGMVEVPYNTSITMSRDLATLIDSSAIDGLITTPYWYNQAWFEEICQSSLILPIVTVNRKYPGYAGVMVDSYSSCREMMHHLLHSHGYRKIAMVHGHTENTVHQTRLQGFLDELEESAVELPDHKVVSFKVWNLGAHPSEDNMKRGSLAVGILLDERGLLPGRDIEVIVSVTEHVAIGIIHDLQSRGLRVPDDIAVVSVENMLESSIQSPPLTTCGISWELMGELACQEMIAMLENAKDEQCVSVPAHLIIRRSCGCFPEDIAKANFSLQFPEYASWNAATTPYQELLVLFMEAVQAKQEALPHQSRFLQRFEQLCNAEQTSQSDYSFANMMITMLYRESFNCFASNPVHLQKAVGLLHPCTVILHHSQNLTKLKQKILEDRIGIMIQEIGLRLLSTFDVHSLMNILADELPQLTITQCYLSVYEDPHNLRGNARLLLAYNKSGRIVLPGSDVIFPATQFVPFHILQNHRNQNLIVEPLFFASEHLGFVVFQATENGSRIYSMLRSVISSALQGARLIERMQKHAKLLMQANATIKDSLETQKTYQNQLLQAEKMAALGQLVAGFTHEINTPLGIGVTAASFQDQENTILAKKVQEGTLQKQELLDFLETSSNSSKLILSNLSRAEQLMKSFKHIAADQTFEEERNFLFGEYLQDVINSLQPRLKKTRHKVVLNCPKNLQVFSHPGAWYQIISNLIINSLVHGLETLPNGEMMITVTKNTSHLLVKYTDNGKGMDAYTIEKMFTPFFTTKRGEGGTGLGMSIVHNLVSLKMNGTITCSSQSGKGVQFDIAIPL